MFSQRPSLRRFLAPVLFAGRRFTRDDQGVTAVEFGLLALPFFTIIFAILQTAIMFLGMQVLDSAVEDASRRVRTGVALTSGYTMTDFRNYLCGYTFNLFDCSQIKIKVQVISNFSSATTNPTVQTCNATTCTWSFTEDFHCGAGGNVMQVSAYYRWPLTIVLPYFNLKNQPDNYRMIGAVRVFRNEPFSGACP
jgi:Flp pilus assembly protein TadG